MLNTDRVMSWIDRSPYASLREELGVTLRTCLLTKSEREVGRQGIVDDGVDDH
jgi:hypothetical protein